jgi:hypothetical protein
MQSTELVQWQVGKREEDGRLTFTRDGAQSIFSLTRAKALAKKRGPEWSLFHVKTNLSPEAQATFEAEYTQPTEDQSKPEGQFGGQWGK